MKVVYGVVALMGMVAGLSAQSTDAAKERRGDEVPAMTKTVYLENAGQANEANEILTALRLIEPPAFKLYLTPSQNAITMAGTAAEIALGEKLIHELDRPKKAYRLNYTITEFDGAKKIGVSHTMMLVTAGQRSTLKNGSKVPVATGTYNATGSTGTQTQFTYLDVGLNLDATLDEYAGGGRLKSKVEQSGIGEEKQMLGIQEPVVRQTVMEGIVLLTIGKPAMLGTLDITGSTRRLEVEVMMEAAK